MCGMFQGLFLHNRFDIVIIGSEIPKWFRHQRIGNEVSIQEPYSILCNEWTGIAICIVFCSLPRHQIHKDCSISCYLIANKKEMTFEPHTNNIVPLSDHIWLIYLLPQFFEWEELDIKLVQECDANGSVRLGLELMVGAWM